MGEYRHVQKALSHVSSKLRENLLPKKDLEETRARVSNPYESAGASNVYNLQPSHQVSLFLSLKLEFSLLSVLLRMTNCFFHLRTMVVRQNHRKQQTEVILSRYQMVNLS